MDYKKKYKEAVCNVQKLLKKGRKEGEVICAYEADFKSIFPELAKSEDEIIREEIIDFLRHPVGKRGHEEWIAWLEKQGNSQLPTFTFDDVLAVQCCMETVKKVQEDKELYSQLQSLHARLYDAYWFETQDEPKDIPADAVLDSNKDGLIADTIRLKPKFKVGDWIIDNNIKTPFQITGMANEKYDVISIYGEDMTFSSNEVERFYHLWTIQDAKDGDVLANDNHILILRKLGYSWAADENPDSLYAYCGIKPNGNFELEQKGYCFCGPLYVHPATKEQQDLLFQKMKEAGYEWDDGKKELKKIESVECSEDNLPEFESYLCLMFQKFRIKYSTKGVCTNGEIIDFVEEHVQKLKDTLCHAWSEEDELNLSEALHHIRMYNLAYKADKLDKWLKSLKTRVQPKSTWSEEDERQYRAAIAICNSLGHTNTANWLKSHRPQSTWKPSKAQMRDLSFIADQNKGNIVGKTMISLYKDLIKLTE